MRFMVESHFAAPPTPDVLALVGAEQARGQECDAQGLREVLFIRADLTGSWQVFSVPSQADLETLLASLPFHPYMVETITPLTDSNHVVT
jgi:muconolactone delta-isomerase